MGTKTTTKVPVPFVVVSYVGPLDWLEMGCLGKPAFTRRAQVRQIGANEERSVLTLRKRRVNAKVACLSYAEGSCWVMQWMLPPPKTTCSD